jgi:putative phage-type endonuclease
MIQGSAEWLQARAGNCTGSRMYDACANGKTGKYYQARADYMNELLIERLTGKASEHFVSDAMQWGLMNEDDARAVYEINTGRIVTACAYFEHPSIAHSGASPDGLVDDDGDVEIKCPTTAVHLETILSGIIPEKHTYQMAWEAECSRRKWVDFISYDPRLPGNLSFFCKRYTPEPAFLEELRAEVIKFLAELDELEAKVRAYKGG